MTSHHRTVGILGGGQLGRMLSHPASLLSIPLVILDSTPDTPAKQITPVPASYPHRAHPDAAFNSHEDILELAGNVDVLTVEIEHVNTETLLQIEHEGRCEVQPSAKTIRLIQDKFRQKEYLRENGLPVAPFLPVPPNPTGEDWQLLERELGTPLMLKSRTLAYDGKGNSPLPSISASDIASSMSQLTSGTGGTELSLYAEKWQRFENEVAVMVVRNTRGEVRSYDAVETMHKDSILRVCTSPLRMHDWDRAERGAEGSVNERARRLAEKAVGVLEGAGVFGVELFLMSDGQSPSPLLNRCSRSDPCRLTPLHKTTTRAGELLINEIAPRPHNSGHHTIEACHTSQFENHLRAILSLPLGSTSLRVPAAGMINLIGTSSSWDPINRVTAAALAVQGASVHLYGKKECRKGRKVGHVTVTGENDAVVRERMRTILLQMEDLDSSWIDQHLGPDPTESLVKSKSHPQPVVGIIMGSDSDLPVLLPATRILTKFQIPYELTICSAHRTPHRMTQYARTAAGRGLKCIIAGAGGAAHLPGMVASETALPVVGVPVRGSVLDGVDSLYSIVQMPVSPAVLPPIPSVCSKVTDHDPPHSPLRPGQRGIPTATVGINNSTNAALLAIRIVGSSNPAVLRQVEAYADELEQEVMGKIGRLEEVGWEVYAEGLSK
jgi:phosphoribosylaminoimidazole carboxylase